VPQKTRRILGVFAMLAACGATACDGSDPVLGSSPGAGGSQAESTGADAGGANGDASSMDSAPPLLSNPAGDAASAPDTSPGFQDPVAEDAGCVPPNLVCGGDAGDAGPACVDVQEDVNNCGACGHVCMGPSATCIGGQCACSELGFLYCAGACIDTTGDVNNCGACGHVCDPSQFNACAGSLCVSM
jgi:hypothetical protein